jgi:hypothetical protein
MIMPGTTTETKKWCRRRRDRGWAATAALLATKANVIPFFATVDKNSNRNTIISAMDGTAGSVGGYLNQSQKAPYIYIYRKTLRENIIRTCVSFSSLFITTKIGSIFNFRVITEKQFQIKETVEHK